MGAMDKIKEVMKGGTGDHKHTPIDDAWEQIVSVAGPKLAEGIWAAVPASLRDLVCKPGAENIFQLLSFGFARILPDSGVGAFVNSLQREVAGELRELAQQHHRGETHVPTSSAGSVSREGQKNGEAVQGSHQVLRLELLRAEKVAAWLTGALAAGMPAADLVKFLDSLTLRELRTFADMSDEAKRAYAGSVLKKAVPQVSSEKGNKVLDWLGARWQGFADAITELDANLTDLALEEDGRVSLLEERVGRLREEASAPTGREGWKIWKL